MVISVNILEVVKLYLYLIKLHTKNKYGAMEVKLHAFLNSVL